MRAISVYVRPDANRMRGLTTTLEIRMEPAPRPNSPRLLFETDAVVADAR